MRAEDIARALPARGAPDEPQGFERNCLRRDQPASKGEPDGRYDESVAATVPGLDVTRIARIVVKSRRTSCMQEVIASSPTGAPPNPVKQLLLGHETRRLFEQCSQHCSRFWSEPCGPAIAVQVAGFDVEAHLAERRHMPGIFQRPWRVPGNLFRNSTITSRSWRPRIVPRGTAASNLGKDWMNRLLRPVLGFVMLLAVCRPAAADVVSSDWNEKVISFAVARGWGPAADRLMAMTNLAMFDAVNAVERRYRPYLMNFEATAPTSKEAAAASAAASLLASVDPSAAKEAKLALAAYLANIPDGAPKQNGIELGEAVAAKMVGLRADDGAQAPDTWRPRTSPGVYVPTAPVVAPQWPGVKPFALKSADQVRPGPPPALTSKAWADDYNEIKELGSRNSVKRSARQTEDARFWLATDWRVYYPVIKQVASKRNLSLLDSARFSALAVVARTDAVIAVFDAKYHYNFWRPVTAIRNGDTDDNPATERDPAWLAFDVTPAHPAVSLRALHFQCEHRQCC